MITERIPALQSLSLEEKWQLANELWDEIDQHQDSLPTPDEVAAVVRERFVEYEVDPSSAMSLEEFKRRHHLP